ncbi:MAG: Undecaprenyl-diphosphatase [candidate division WWE3 bacterium GW2011_GWF2_41_45]|uniref:Undecaprenyl-diphosphatase n=2 Tax=Katanobacteria TaxID=422282 RepID=A0A1F4W4H9_UNCKA|nr:MAG: Undecaprenyl-diphosphatase [candidate division WWE3 bacterium GW2011_GWC2_41_23]KKS10738.1 MAG: Undecaprenyl-diphosphatase [candidate division WWE3 bacterium GW2011_GWF2_41_45]KKS12415.1 MAG: Undecaprenyl-diphosphatase [candidate division WWE3 bacterium GW2011_GWF1_41_53]KKS20206.1 MAG: Undecaprenyl-diphosphatase [candidate division WWE3 bacterium GW2011_GWE1_41_72]KKS28146.1 MAG: Undecaprenyl-diphosphatase [candidate division WWE3 bacterium GW2011_GWC1_42_102]KKS51310.1 MAG: Undecapre
MTFFQSVVLGIVQGLTEFIPVSSSGHLIIFPELLGWEQGGLAFDTTLHLGTLTALLVYFYKDLRGMFNSLLLDFKKYGRFFSQFSPESKLVMWLLIATIPAGLGGYFLGDFLEATFRSMLSVAIFLILGSILMLVAEKKTKLVDKALPAPALSFKKILTSGLFQCLALFPGFSRSGATISGGLLSGLNRLQAAKVSFLLSIPIIAAAGIFQLPDALGDYSGAGMGILISGFLSSAVSGYLAVSGLMKYLNSHGLKVFVVYRLALSLLLIFLYLY